jgi:ABC-2 type transport system permease protein
VLAVVPVVAAVAQQRFGHAPPAVAWRQVFSLGLSILAVIPPLLVAGSIGDDLDDRTVAYLWSRPLPRWSLVTGVLLAMVPVTAAVLAIALGVACALTWGPAIDPVVVARLLAATTLGALAASALSAAVAAWSARFGTAMAVVYLLIVDGALDAVPASLHDLSIRHHVVALAGVEADPGSPLVAAAGLTVLAAAWTALAMRRVRRVD